MKARIVDKSLKENSAVIVAKIQMLKELIFRIFSLGSLKVFFK
jgi:hypothetical protein